jgi:MFS family permease
MSGIPAPSLALLSVITALAFCGLHMVVPALPLLVAVFADTPAHLQLVVSLYLAGIGAGQLVYGPVSDRSGDVRYCSPVSRRFSTWQAAHLRCTSARSCGGGYGWTLR